MHDSGVLHWMVMKTCLAVLAICLATPALTAQDEGGYETELSDARRYLRQGKREAARTKYEEVLDAVETEEFEEDKPAPAERAEALEGLARIALELGRYKDARERVEAARKRQARVEQDILTARLDAKAGLWDKAIAAVTKARGQVSFPDPRAFEAAILRAELLSERGQRDDARKIYGRVVEAARGKELVAVNRLQYAKALIALGGSDNLYEASDALIRATQDDKLLAEAYLVRGNLLFDVYRETRGQPSGESEYKRALQHCGENEPILLALYRTRRQNFLLDSAKTDAYLRRALAVNPNSVEALRLRASGMIDDRRFRSALAMLKRALAINPHDKRTLAELVAVSHLLYREADEKAYRERIAGIDAKYSRVDTVLGEHLVALYRFSDSLPFLRRAERADPNDARNLLALGRALIYAGKGDEGARVLRRTKELQRGFLNPWRENQLFLQQRLEEKYERVAIGNFIFRIHPSEKDVLVPYLSREYEKAWRRLGSKYGIFPDCKVAVEGFERFGDFSVRTIGFKGFGALGACFGCFITSVSPAAPELRQQFSWKVTAWHEFAHVLHLQLSRARVPRWLTEGAAVYEEISLDPSYDRRMEREIYSALKNDAVIPLERLNSVFRGSQILLGYYQGGLICRHIAKDWGFDKVVKILNLYGKDKSTEQIFEEVLGLSPREYDIKFRNYLDSLVGSYRLTPLIDEKTLDSLWSRVSRDPSDKEARLRLAQGFVQRGNIVDAGQQIAALNRLDPGNGDVLLLRAKIAASRRGGDPLEVRRLLKEGFEKGGEDFDARMSYARILEKAGRERDALAQYDAAIKCWPTCPDPGPASPFMGKVRVLLELGRRAEAMRTLRAYARINGRDYGAHTQLASWFREQNDPRREAFHLEQARDIDPFDRKLHERLGELYTAAGNHAEAGFVFGICAAIPIQKDRSQRSQPRGPGGAGRPKASTPEDEARYKAKMRLRQAEAYVSAKRPADARDAAKKALQGAEHLDSSEVSRAREIAAKK